MNTSASVSPLASFTTELNAYLIPFYAGKVLVLKRKAGFWEFPGGGIDFGEHPEKSALRETMEETGLRAKNLSLVGVTSAVYPKDGNEKHSVYIIYKGEVDSGDFTLGPEHEDGRWVMPEELQFLKLGYNAQDAWDLLNRK